ncbi:hypothetical protein OF829_07730 [Sphingomonas sp. LB-2]|uniref:hypothetical protein n=1 Tax=Sphingomonas caeni TaxID=2984949 RepID=UPI00222F47EA|nr:hypothetical protein [Sphingomonas caeni]MCW3847126.1 hypothetical protein [Sphingomonas caeni]
MRALIVAALLAAGLPAITAHAQTAPAALADPEPIANHIFEPLKQGNVEDAVKAIVDASPSTSPDLAARLDGIRRQIQAMITESGPVVRWERVKTESLGTMVRRDTYIVLHKNTVMRWRFIYMKLDRGWMIGGFAFESEAGTWFD